MKTIKVPADNEDFDLWRELGAEEFERTPAHMIGKRIARLMSDAKASCAGAEEKACWQGSWKRYRT